MLDLYLIANLSSLLSIKNPTIKEEKKWRNSCKMGIMFISILRSGSHQWVMPLWRTWRWYWHPFGEEVENKTFVWKSWFLLLWPEKFWAFIQPHGCPCPCCSARTNKKQESKENSQRKGFARKMQGFRIMRISHENGRNKLR